MSTEEYGVIHSRLPDELHRGPWTEHEARSWIAEAEDDGFKAGVFKVVRREVGPWEIAP